MAEKRSEETARTPLEMGETDPGLTMAAHAHGVSANAEKVAPGVTPASGRREPQDENAGPAACPICHEPISAHGYRHMLTAGKNPKREVCPPGAIERAAAEPAEKRWKVGDRVCFADHPLGQVYSVWRIELEEPRVQVVGVAGLFASHLFVPAPAEPISLPAPEVTPLRDSPRGLHPERAIVGADRPGHASPTDPGAGSTGNSDRSAPESPAPASSVAQLLPVLTTIAAELTKIRIELGVRNGLAAGRGYPE